MNGTSCLVVITGILGHEPRFAGEGDTRRCKLNLSTRSRVWDASLQAWQDRTEWHDVIIHNKGALKAAEYLHKGNLATVMGTLQTRAYTNREGHPARATEVIVQPYEGKLILFGKKQQPDPTEQEQMTSAAYQRASNGA